MGGEEHSHIFVLPQRLHHVPQKAAGLWVESGCRLVEDKNLGFVQQCSGNVDSAALTAGELAQRAVYYILEVKQFRKLLKAFFEGFARDSVKRGATAQILLYCQLLIEHTALEHNAKLSGNVLHAGINTFAADLNTAAVLFELPADNRNRSRFACSVHAEEGEKLALLYMKGKVIHGVNFAEGLVQIFNFNNSFHLFSPNQNFRTYITFSGGCTQQIRRGNL